MCDVTGQKLIREAMQSHSLSGSRLRTRRSYLLVVRSRAYTTGKHPGKAAEILEKKLGVQITMMNGLRNLSRRSPEIFQTYHEPRYYEIQGGKLDYFRDIAKATRLDDLY